MNWYETQQPRQQPIGPGSPIILFIYAFLEVREVVHCRLEVGPWSFVLVITAVHTSVSLVDV